MPRKTSRAERREGGVWSFNEAAARCRGKRAARRAAAERGAASMRPRPDAAENLACGRLGRLGSQASMRLRPDAAENAGWPEARVIIPQSLQ